MRLISTLLLCAFTLLASLTLSHAQDEQEKSTLLKFVESKLSSPNRQISLNGLQGTLSSNVKLDSITIADSKGIWLTIVKPELVWTRTALLTGKLEIESLVAERIDFPRNPEPDTSVPAPESGGFTLPELPVSVRLGKLSVPLIRFGPTVFGLAADTGVAGRMVLADGTLDVDLAINRLDGPKGSFTIKAGYANETRVLDLDVKLSEPANGILANALNIENQPPVDVIITGKAPVDDLKVNIGFDVAERRVLGGQLKLNKVDAGQLLRFDLAGPLSSIMPADAKAFFGQISQLSAEALFQPNGDIDLKTFSLDSGALAVSARAKRLADGFISVMDLDAALANSSGKPVVLPAGDKPTSISSAVISLNYDAQQNEAWKGNITVLDLKQDGMAVDTTAFVADGTVTGLNDPANRQITFNLRGGIDQFTSNDAALNRALGPAIRMVGSGSWKSGQPLRMQQFSMSGDTFNSNANGEIADGTFTGSVEMQLSSLADFSGVAERSLSGRANLRTDGQIDFSGGGFDLRVNGTTQDLTISDKTIDPLLQGQVTLAGGIARGEEGLRFHQLRLGNGQFDALIDGRYSSTLADLTIAANLRDAAVITQRASGGVSVNGSLVGSQKPYLVNAELAMNSGRLSGRVVKDLAIRFKGETDGEAVRGDLSSQGSVDRKLVKLAGVINAGAEKMDLQGLLAEIGNARLSGNLSRSADGLIKASLDVKADDVSDLAALALADASGSINGKVRLQPDNGKQAAVVALKARSLRFEEYRLDAATIDANAEDLLGSPSINAVIDVSGLTAAGVNVRSLNGTINTSGSVSDFDVKAALDQHKVRIATRGQVQQNGRVMTVRVDALSLQSNITDARLTSPTTIVLRDGTTRFNNASLAVGSGSVRLNGSAGARFDLDAAINNFPLVIINAIQPQTAAAGSVSGTATISGTPEYPQVVFNLDGSRVSVRQIAAAGVTPLNISARGRFANNQLDLESVSARNSQDIAVNASGRLPLSGSGLSIAAKGTAPLALAQSALANRGASASGIARFDVKVQGSLDNPQTSGLIAVENGSLTDPLSNLKLVNIGLLAGIDGERISINRASASLSSGGSINASGSVGLKGDMPSNITVKLANARYTDGQTFNTSADGQLTLTGNLLADPLLGGQINLGTTEITVPESLAKGSQLLEVKHVNPSGNTRQTLERIKRATPKARPTSRPSIMKLGITVDAPNQIFVRGRGLDAELGGRIRIVGPVTNISPIGKFELRRGRLSILGQRIDLTEGSVTLAGDLDPLIDLTATTQAGDVEAMINLKGPASDIQVTFSSSPELPQDEILAKIIFGRDLGDLSPGQIVRLASIAAELTGGNSPGLVDSLRKGTGLDDLDVVQDSDGNSAVKAGKYVADNVYLGVQAGQTKSTATINLDITDNITARGSVSSEGDTSLGIFLEKDY